MAVPKKRTSKSRQRKRRAQIKLEAPNLIKCPNCGQEKLPHVACPACGFYKDRVVIEVAKKRKRRKKRRKRKKKR
jgi:large subunit ribosomal protein L32